MKLADITAAAIKGNPNLELEVEGTDEPIVFRNLVMVSEEERQKFRGVDKEVDKISKAKGDASAVRRMADSAKYLLGLVVKDKAHLELLEEKFNETPDLRDAQWIAVLNAYHEETQVGEA